MSGLCLRIPHAEKSKLSELQVETLAASFRLVSEALDALATAQEVSDFQAVGVRCREALLAFAGAAQIVMPWSGGSAEKPKQADFKPWVEHVCSVGLAGQTHEQRRHLFRTPLDEACAFQIGSPTPRRPIGMTQRLQSRPSSTRLAYRHLLLFGTCVRCQKHVPPVAQTGCRPNGAFTQLCRTLNGNVQLAKNVAG
jgi:hypothetical protein